MKRLSRSIIALSIFVLAAQSLSADDQLPIVELLGNHYYLYKAKKGESLFGVAKDKGWDESLLLKLNPDAVSPLPKDFAIYYPVEIAEKNDLDETDGNELAQKTGKKKYVIRTGDTLYQLAKSNSTTVAEIMRQNPGISEKNFRAGDTIIIPAPGSGVVVERKEVEETSLNGFTTYKVGKDESWAGISRKTGISVDRLKEANPGVTKLKNKMVISLPLIETVTVERDVEAKDPREETPQGIRDIYAEVHKLSENVNADTLKIALVLAEPSARKDLEFTRGFLTALNNLKQDGKPIAFKVVDGSNSPECIITCLDEYKPTIVFTSEDRNIPGFLGEYSQVSCTPLVNVFDVHNVFYLSNPYMIQLTTPSESFNNAIASYLSDRYGDRTLLFAAAEDPDDAMAAALRASWDLSRVVSVTSDALADYPLSDTSKVLIYGNSIKKGDVSSLLETIATLKEEHPLAEVTTIGRPNWIVYDEQLGDSFRKASVMIPSRFYYDSKSSEADAFVAQYRNLFGRVPQNTFPMYAPFGYDAATYFINGLLKSSFDVNGLGESFGGVQSEFCLDRSNSWTGLVNPLVYLVEFTPFGTNEKIKVR